MTTISRFTLFRLHFLLALRELPRNGRVLGALAGAVAASVWLTYSIVVDWQQPLSTAIRVAASVLLLYYTCLFVLIAHRRTQQNLRDGSSRVQKAEAEYEGHRPYLVEECLRISALVGRAYIEAAVRAERRPRVNPGELRRLALQAAHQIGVWEGFSSAERDLLNAPEGSWTEETIQSTVVRTEDVRVLRFALGVDPILMPFEFLTAGADYVLDVIGTPSMLSGSVILPPWELRPAETNAQQMLTRCAGEVVQRLEIDQQETSGTAALVYASERIQHRAPVDLLLGHATVAAADLSEIRRIGAAALRRVVCVSELIALLYLPAAPLRLTHGVLGQEDHTLTGPQEI